ncbi:hypothetical protein M413DRAFT_146850 [Hebeloma cylindrosporum]|uniref:Hyaluronan/mRNA-binding protein domain-containing protein n=1 Tax=Hebeloma cylindrosporum TaxID=76867 RepID=A0A0C3CAV1_HEBCY|nr:hypothetical protein M413DRAFT_146850 [Hebeloma cylindrosporum h7]
MTRTARAAYPRAVVKDRSESRSGLDNSLRKAGAGHHNWGSLADEQQLEFAALHDRAFEEEEHAEPLAGAEDTNSTRSTRSVSPATKPEISSEMSEEDLEKARQFRKNTFKKTGGTQLSSPHTNGHLTPSVDIDLTAIARTSVVVGSPPQGRPVQDNKRVSAASSIPSLV